MMVISEASRGLVQPVDDAALWPPDPSIDDYSVAEQIYYLAQEVKYEFSRRMSLQTDDHFFQQKRAVWRNAISDPSTLGGWRGLAQSVEQSGEVHWSQDQTSTDITLIGLFFPTPNQCSTTVVKRPWYVLSCLWDGTC